VTTTTQPIIGLFVPIEEILY